MTDALTTEIRRALAELVDAAPLAPDPRTLGSPTHRRRRRPARVAALVVVAAVAVGAVALTSRGDPSTRVAAGPRPSVDPTTVVPPDPAPEPTLVIPARPPAGLRLVDGGQTRLSSGNQEMVLAGPDGGFAHLVWTVAGSGGCAGGRPVTTVRGGQGAPVAGTVPTGPDQATFSTTGGDGALHWCDAAGSQLNLLTTGLDEATARALARAVHTVDGDPDGHTVSLPAGFVGGRPRSGRTYTLAFRPDDAISSRPQLRVMVQPAWTTDVRLLRAASGAGATDAAVDVLPGGRAGYAWQLPGGARYQSVTVVYDARTVVTLSGDGLTRDELLSAAASLVPADPAVAPDVAGDPQRCNRLGLCG